MGLVHTEAIVLRTFKLAEADRIVVFLTKDAGLVRGVARGARRLKNRFGASLEPFTEVSIAYFEREGRELVSISQTEILRSHFALAQHSETVAALEYLSELALEFSPPREPNERLFRMIRACMNALSKAPERMHVLARYFEVWVLRLSGFLPDLGACTACKRRFVGQKRETVYLGPESALKCSDCAGGLGLQISPEAHAQLMSILRLGPAEWGQEADALRKGLRGELAQLSERLIVRALERAPRGGLAQL